MPKWNQTINPLKILKMSYLCLVPLLDEPKLILKE